MLTTSEIRKSYEKIQKQLFYMIPEKWDKVFLYASVLEHYNSIQTGEMFFYYYPKSVLKKNPVNVYEVPNKFNIDEKAYLKLAEKLYDELKKLREYFITSGEKPWTNLTISIQNFKFNVEYSYENLVNSKYTSYDRHLIWRHKYLDIPLTSYQKKDRKMIEEYLEEEEHNKKISTYNEGIYKKPVSNITEYNKPEVKEEATYIKEDNDNVGADSISDQKENKNVENNTHIGSKQEEPIIKSQILNINN